MALLESKYMTYLVFRLLSENLICSTANIIAVSSAVNTVALVGREFWLILLEDTAAQPTPTEDLDPSVYIAL